MNTKQLKTIQKFIKHVVALSTYTDRDGDIKWINGAIVWSIDPAEHNQVKTGEYWLRATNATNESKWHNTHLFLNILIGTRGGIKIYHAEGLERKYILKYK
jgi:hypothetical protein